MLSESGKMRYFTKVLTLLLLTMASIQQCLLQTNSLFQLHLSEAQGRYNLGQICQNSETKISNLASYTMT